MSGFTTGRCLVVIRFEHILAIRLVTMYLNDAPVEVSLCTSSNAFCHYSVLVNTPTYYRFRSHYHSLFCSLIFLLLLLIHVIYLRMYSLLITLISSKKSYWIALLKTFKIRYHSLFLLSLQFLDIISRDFFAYICLHCWLDLETRGRGNKPLYMWMNTNLHSSTHMYLTGHPSKEKSQTIFTKQIFPYQIA